MLNDPVLRICLLANAILSLVCGGVLVVAAGSVGEMLGVQVDAWLRTLGVILVAHGVILIVVRGRSDLIAWTKLNLAMIAPYPVVMVVLALAVIDEPGGRALVLLDGALVGTCAVLQFVGVRGAAERHVFATS